MPLAKIEDAITAIRRGKMIILVDDEARENEGDLVIAAEKVTPEAINFMAKWGRGLICLTLTQEQLDKLQIPMMVTKNATPLGTAFTVSIEASKGVTTGISAADRAHTIRVAVNENATPQDIVSPGHIFPLRAREGGVLTRTGQTEGSVDLSRLANLHPSAVICEILNDDGTMARLPDLELFAEKHDLLVVSIADLIKYRYERQQLVKCVLDEPFPCAWGDNFRIRVYKTAIDNTEHIALICGDPSKATEAVPVRVTDPCIAGDVFQGSKMSCTNSVHGAMKHIAENGVGVFVYLDNPVRTRLNDIREQLLGDKQILSPSQKMEQINKVPAQFRDLGEGCQILRDCGVKKLRVLTNSNRKLVGLDAFGLELEGIDPIPEIK